MASGMVPAVGVAVGGSMLMITLSGRRPKAGVGGERFDDAQVGLSEEEGVSPRCRALRPLRSPQNLGRLSFSASARRICKTCPGRLGLNVMASSCRRSPGRGIETAAAGI